jgi:ferredoxin-NADP reductase
MIKTSFTLISKQTLTHDVYELVYSCSELPKESPKAGQYVMFQLAPWLNRAYSLAKFTTDTFTLIIKKISDGRGSPLICDAEIGTIVSGMIPLGHFTIMDTPRSKCFIGTGTGFAPLYCQLLASSESADKPEKILFNFWVRTFADSFYEDEIIKVGKGFDDFSYIQYFSRESEFLSLRQSNPPTIQQSGYVTDWIIAENIIPYEEFYICWSPAMVKSAREKLASLSVPKEDIFWEQF